MLTLYREIKLSRESFTNMMSNNCLDAVLMFEKEENRKLFFVPNWTKLQVSKSDLKKFLNIFNSFTKMFVNIFNFRNSSVFNVFITNLPQVLDQNNIMGWATIPPILAILRHCPCPPHSVLTTEYQPPIYSLWYLEPHIRRSWLMSLLIILYKVSFNFYH